MMQLHETLVKPREVMWIWLRVLMKNSCASCWAYPESSDDAFQVVANNETGPYGVESSEYIYRDFFSGSCSIHFGDDTLPP